MKSMFYNEDILDRFDKSLKRDKSNDIIKGNSYLNDKEKYGFSEERQNALSPSVIQEGLRL